jgi:ABC-type dipeptide/oligopeptide/nickel transport system ATPase component
VIKNSSRIAVYGRSGSGKSTYVKNLIKKLKRVVVFDVMAEYSQLQGYETAYDINQVKAIMIRKPKTFKIAYQSRAGSEQQDLHLLSCLLALAQTPYLKGIHNTELTLVAEELSTAYPNQIKQNLNGFQNLCQRGRHYGINIIGITQRPATVSKNFFGNTNKTIIFPLAWQDDIKGILNLIGKKYQQDLLNLQPHNYLVFENFTITRGKNRL